MEQFDDPQAIIVVAFALLAVVVTAVSVLRAIRVWAERDLDGEVTLVGLCPEPALEAEPER